MSDPETEPTGGLAWTPDEEIEESQARLRESHPEVWAAWVRWLDENAPTPDPKPWDDCPRCKKAAEKWEDEDV